MLSTIRGLYGSVLIYVVLFVCSFFNEFYPKVSAFFPAIKIYKQQTGLTELYQSSVDQKSGCAWMGLLRLGSQSGHLWVWLSSEPWGRIHFQAPSDCWQKVVPWSCRAKDRVSLLFTDCQLVMISLSCKSLTLCTGTSQHRCLLSSIPADHVSLLSSSALALCF